MSEKVVRYSLSIFKNPEPHQLGQFVRYSDYRDQEIVAQHLHKALDRSDAECQRIQNESKLIGRQLSRASVRAYFMTGLLMLSVALNGIALSIAGIWWFAS